MIHDIDKNRHFSVYLCLGVLEPDSTLTSHRSGGLGTGGQCIPFMDLKQDRLYEDKIVLKRLSGFKKKNFLNFYMDFCDGFYKMRTCRF